MTGSDAHNIYVKDMEGGPVQISISIVENESTCSDQFTVAKKVTRTELSHIIQNIGHAVFRVTFNKKPTAEGMVTAYEAEDTSTTAKKIKVMKSLIDGELRVLHGRLHRTKEYETSVEVGRIAVIDLKESVPGNAAFRLVDTRAITELIVEGKRYFV